MKNINSRFITRAGVIAAFYAVLTILLKEISYGPLQFRLSEALTVLPYFFVEAIPGLFIGCLLANIINGPYDMILGSLATLIAAICTHLLRKRFFVWGFLPPIIINALVVPIILLTIPEVQTGYWFNALTVLAGQTAVLFSAGLLLYFEIKKRFIRGLFGIEHKAVRKDAGVAEGGHKSEQLGE